MKNINPYLNFMGNAEEAMNFYKSVFGGEFTTFKRYGEIPGGDKLPEEDQRRINHISLPLSNTGTSIMATDVLVSMKMSLTVGNNCHICINTESEMEAEKLFDGLSANGKVEMPLNKTFWGSYFGMCIDKFGIQWMINFDYNQQ